MSNPPLDPENAAAAAAVSPVRAAGAAPGPGTAYPPQSPTPRPPAPRPAAAAALEAGPASSVPPLPLPLPPSSTPLPPPPQPPLPLPPAGSQQGTPGTDPLAAQATGGSAAPPFADPVNNKYARGPAVLQRPQGPSLLTQALATARGIPRQQPQPDSSSSLPPNTKPTSLPSDPSRPSTLEPLEPSSSSRDTEGRDPRHGSLPPADGEPLMLRLSPRKKNMSSSTATATAVAAPVCARLDLGEVNSMLNGHREFLSKSKGRSGGSSEPSERDRPPRWNTFSPDSTGSNSLVSPRMTDSPVALHDGAENGHGAPDSRSPLRAWKTDHRVTMGPEKAWSIGSGDASDAQDGQVEKSISEVLAGVEHNARSRKASHSLRFFKEGLPEEKAKRKDSRSSQSAREKSPARVDKLADIQEKPAGRETLEGQAVDDGASAPERQHRARTVPLPSPEPKAAQGSPQDHVTPKEGGAAPEADAEPAVLGRKEGLEKQHAHELLTDSGDQLKPRRVSNLSIGAGESAEEGEESGEEKISSAVFLPHQAPEEPQEHAPTAGAPQRIVPSRRHSRIDDDANPWLVKADEPEVDDEQRESIDFEESERRPEAAEYPSVAPEVASRQVDVSAPADQREPAVLSSRLSRPVSQYHEDAVHDHQLAPKQPLDAIELIPYKHQVGGHTTLWRFSRRAVCKQLNNRENEFYEKIEKYHRDLLLFLPRYIGVLNVTYQKQPRRKSTMKRDEAAALGRSQPALNGSSENPKSNGVASVETAQQPSESHAVSAPRVISQSLHASVGQIPTVTFADNQHILPRSLMQPTASPPCYLGHLRSGSASTQALVTGGQGERAVGARTDLARPNFPDRPANSWGATMVNKRLRNEVFNDAFLKEPVAIHRHRKGHHRLARRAVLPRSGSDPSLTESHEKRSQSVSPASEPQGKPNGSSHAHTQSDFGQTHDFGDDDESVPPDVTGTSAPEPEILGGSSPGMKKKRRYSGTGLRRKPKDVRDGRGDLQYFEEADDAGYNKGRAGEEEPAPMEMFSASPERERRAREPVPVPTPAPVPVEAEFTGPLEFGGKIPRPINPKEAQTQRDSRVEYFLLLEDLTAGMKRPCIMDLKMGTRQYGVDASPKKQKSQQGKCAKTTSRELGVRVCGLQVWDAKTRSYIFKDKYYGRALKKGAEFQAALTRFLYDGVDRASILRHIPTVLDKLDELEVIIQRLRGYRFYAASLLMFYDGDDSNNSSENNYIDDSTTDFATDTEETRPRNSRRRAPREIDFKMADFANCVTAGDVSARDRPCPPRHPEEPDKGFLKGLESLRRYFLRIQRDTRREMGLVSAGGLRGFEEREDGDFWGREEEGEVSE
ncbi:inositol hexakisphosphate kinase 1 [Staphylotrichum tortipilum]|uniref:Kinase n=1 Tax=Staphylotrichum tortipilum TaxID=2831512 RepID=A0AAN6MU25_9PEZI|nr:inositol hexakisphosphate kinase 1 [Staphylotrichum longicolle]